MCELFAASSKNRIKLNELLKEFFSHSIEHPNGWGMVAFDEHKSRVDHIVRIEKEEKRAIDSQYLEEILSSDIESAGLFAHIRRATIGEISTRNCHPFMQEDILGNKWYFMHNGTIFESDLIEKYRSIQTGTTDSERVLFLIIDRINEAIKANNGELTSDKKFQVIDQIILNISKGNKLNIIMYDGEYYYIHMNQEKTLFMKKTAESAIFSTTQLDEEEWIEVPQNQLQVYRDGEFIYSGTIHNNSYYYDPEQYTYLFMAYANM